MWRKGLFLSATFLLAVLVLPACKKKETQIGGNTIDQSELLNSGGIDTFSLTTFTIEIDSVVTDNAAYGMLGSYHDPVFGTMSAEIYTQFRLSGLSPNFGTDPIVIDSFVVGLVYANYYGEVGNQTFEAYEINDVNGLSMDTAYYNTSSLATTGTNLVPPGMEVINADPAEVTVIGGDTVGSQLRIHLDTALARTMIDEAIMNSTTFESNENFVDYFKGLHIKTMNGFQASGEGAIFYFDLNDASSKMTIYYTQNGDQKAFDFLINSQCVDFNHVEVDYTMTDVENVIADTVSGQDQFYAQAFKSRAVVRIPGLDKIPANAVIHKALLELPVQYQTGTAYDPGGVLTTVVRDQEESELFYAIAPISSYDDYRKSFIVDLRGQVQNIINGTTTNDDIILYPSLFISSASRIIFNGPDTGNKAKPILTIIYTEF